MIPDFANLNPAMLFGAAALFVGVLLVVTSSSTIVGERVALLRRLTGPYRPATPRSEAAAAEIFLDDNLLRRFSRYVTPAKEEERAAAQERLIRAGYRRPSAVRVFYLARAASALLFAALGAVFISVVNIPLPLPIRLSLLIFPVLIGFLVPALWVDWKAARRSQEAEYGFPDVLDMLLVCIEAGQSFDQACRRVARDIKGVSKVLAEELGLMNEELRAGRDRAAAFHDFASHLAVDDIKAFVTVLRQSDEFGVSISESLRVYADDMRNKRLMRAEEKANLMPLKLALGTMFFTVPPTMLVMGGPSLLMLLRAFSHMGSGGQ